MLLPMAMAGGFRCVCPDGYSGTHCELGRLIIRLFERVYREIHVVVIGLFNLQLIQAFVDIKLKAPSHHFSVPKDEEWHIE